VVGCCEPGNENSGSIKRWNFSTSWKTISLLRMTLSHGIRRWDFDIGHTALEPKLFVVYLIWQKNSWRQ
jgi:hypothetical protein